MRVYADTSFLASLYAIDAHSAEAERRIRQFTPEILLTPLTELELSNALQLRVFRREASASEIRAARRHLDQHIRDGVFSVVPMPPEAFSLAQKIAVTRTSTVGARTLDILHVASAMLLQAERFWTFDARQSELAKAEGLRQR